MVPKPLSQRPNESDKDFEKRKKKKIQDAERYQRRKLEKEKLEKRREQDRIRSRRYLANKKKKAADKEKAAADKEKAAADKETKRDQEMKELRDELQGVKKKITELETHQQRNPNDIGKAIGLCENKMEIESLENHPYSNENGIHVSESHPGTPLLGSSSRAPPGTAFVDMTNDQQVMAIFDHEANAVKNSTELRQTLQASHDLHSERMKATHDLHSERMMKITEKEQQAVENMRRIYQEAKGQACRRSNSSTPTSTSARFTR